MKHLLSQIFISLILINMAYADYAVIANPKLDDKDIIQIKEKLQAYEKGQLTLEEVTMPDNGVWGYKLLLYYKTHTNEVTTKMKLPISRWYGATGNDSEAAKLAEDYVQVYSNDCYAWGVIGSANLDMGNLDTSMKAYVKSVQLGDDANCAPLAFVSIKNDRLDIVKKMLPRLFILKNAKATRYIEPLDIVTALVLYSLRSNEKDIFVKALDNLSNKDILTRSDLRFLIEQGCKQFKGKDIDKIQEELKIAEIDNSTTNAPSP